MTVWLVSRHAGAVAWVLAQGWVVDRQVPHLDVAEVADGDAVIGTLPVHLAAKGCARGARYLHLALDVPLHMRGLELTADDLAQAGARLMAFRVLPYP